ncbi:kinase-like domain-containing protein [Pisolithus marmoratus]|nr:kinase-like domain-containing protein [Pisolithus marmoratus]
MESLQVNDKTWIRILTLLAYKIVSQKHLWRLWQWPGRPIFLPMKMCIKSTSCTRLAEASAMQFVARHTSIPVPKVYCVFKHKGTTIQELRSIAPKSDVGVSNVDGGPIYDQRLPKKLLWGPFKTIQDFHRELRDGVEVKGLTGGMPPGLDQLVSYHNQHWPESVFTHGDLSSSNILVQGDRIVGIIDWETAGWYPPYWE